MKESFSPDGIPVIIRATNEQEDLPKLLFALARSSTPINPIIIDNNSIDNTPKIGESLGLPVIQEKKKGIVYASIAAFEYIKESHLDATPVLFTDADCIPGVKWAGV